MSEDEQLHALNDSSDVQAKLQDRLSILEYCCYTIRRVATNLDAFARAKAAPKTKSYALDADATEDPTVHCIRIPVMTIISKLLQKTGWMETLMGM